MRSGVVLLAAGVSLISCQTNNSGRTPSPDCVFVEEDHGPTGESAVRVETLAEGLEVPWAIAFLPDGDLLVTERPGRLRRIHDGVLQEAPVAEVEVDAVDESGLLGIVLHPDFEQNRSFFLALTAPGGNENRIELWTLSEDGTTASRERVIFSGIPAHRIHDGGRLKIGPDGKLYLSTGDAANPDRSQDAASTAGKILRLELDGSIPSDNPVSGSPVFLSGVRNTQGFDWLDDDTLVLGDHGPSGEFGRRGGDEVNVARRGDNLGWPTIWRCEQRDGLVTPIISFRRATPMAGVAVYRSAAIPDWEGSVVVSTLGSHHLHRIVLDQENRVSRHETYFFDDPPVGFGRLREAIMGPDGHLYLTTSNCDGRGRCPPEKDKLLRVVPTP